MSTTEAVVAFPRIKQYLAEKDIETKKKISFTIAKTNHHQQQKAMEKKSHQGGKRSLQ